MKVYTVQVDNTRPTDNTYNIISSYY